MASTASLRNTSLGRYWPGDSSVHRLDPRAKLLTVALITIAIVIASRWWLTTALFLLMLVVYRLSRLPRAALDGALRPVLPVLGVLAVFQLLFGYESANMLARDVVLITLGPYILTLAHGLSVLLSVGRLLSLVLLVSLLIATTAPSVLVDGLEMLMRPLSRIGLPGHELALIGAIALRFLPIFGEELESVQRAQLARDISGIDTTRWQFARNLRRSARLVVPLFADVYRRADDLATALLARCYQGGRGRTYLRQVRMRGCDYFIMALAVGVLVTTAYMSMAV